MVLERGRVVIEALVAVPVLILTWVGLFALLATWKLVFGEDKLPENPLGGARSSSFAVKVSRQVGHFTSCPSRPSGTRSVRRQDGPA